jgi:hypothetical protein
MIFCGGRRGAGRTEGIGIFNRSYYEDVLAVRVRRDMLGSRIFRSNSSLKLSGLSASTASELSSAQRHVGAEIPFADTAGRSRGDACWRGSTNPPSAGDSPWTMSDRKLWGRYWRPTRMRSAILRPRRRHGTWFRLALAHGRGGGRGCAGAPRSEISSGERQSAGRT